MEHINDELEAKTAKNVKEKGNALRLKLIEDRVALKADTILRNKRENQRKQRLPGAGPIKNVVEGGNPVQIIFPEEIWLLIFDKLNRPKDVQSCYNTCNLFRSFLQGRKSFISYPKVLHVLFSRKYLQRNDLLSLRLVSKTWCQIVNEFLEEKCFWLRPKFSPWKDRVPIVEYNFIDRSLDNWSEVGDTYRSTCKPNSIVKVDMLHHSRNPLLTRFANSHVQFSTEFFDHTDEDACENEDETIGNFLQSCGSHTWYLSLNSSWQRKREEVIYLIQLALRKCVSLKLLKLDIDDYKFRRYEEESCSQSINWNESPNLTCLYLTRADPLYDSLVTKFNLQLQELSVGRWSNIYSNLDWPVLKNLYVDCLDATSDLESVGQLRANNLKTLRLKLGSGYGPQLKLLLQTINHFQQLENLELAFLWKYEINETEVYQTPPILPKMCSVSVKKLMIYLDYQNNITFSLVAYFPNLTELNVTLGVQELRCGFNSDCLGKRKHRKRIHYQSEERIQYELVDVRKYLYVSWTWSTVHESTIWKILPFLRRIKVQSHMRKNNRGANMQIRTQVFVRGRMYCKKKIHAPL